MSKQSSIRFGVGPTSANFAFNLECFSAPDLFEVIPSKNQVNYCGGYTGITTRDLIHSMHRRGHIVKRDHAGMSQSGDLDESVVADIALGIDAIHIDPFKIQFIGDSRDLSSMIKAADLTCRLIDECESLGGVESYEIGTEEGVYPYTAEMLHAFVACVKDGLSSDVFERVTHCVVQTGARILYMSNAANTQTFDEQRCCAMVQVANEFGLVPKEHSCDYMDDSAFNDRMRCGVMAFNVAPQFGTLESGVLLGLLRDNGLVAASSFFESMCRTIDTLDYARQRWVHDSTLSHADVIGHYLFSDDRFKSVVAASLIDVVGKSKIDEKVWAAHTGLLSRFAKIASHGYHT